MEARRGNGAARREGASRLAAAGTGAWHILGIAGVVVLAGWALGRLMPVVLPLLVALMVAALLQPVARWLTRRRLPPAPAALISLLVLLCVAGFAAWLIVPPAVARIGDLGTSVEQGIRQVAYSVGHDVLGADRRQVDRTVDQALSEVRGHIGRVLGGVVTGATVVAEALAGAVLVLFLAFFLIKDGNRVWSWLVGLAPRGRRADLAEVGRRSWSVLSTYVRGIVFVATVDAVGIGAVLVIVGVPLALPLIVLTWVAAFFPIVGAVAAGAAAVLVALVGEGLGSALIVLAGVVAVQQLEGNLLYPVVVGPRLHLHPVVILLAVTAGGTLAGIAGAFLAVPVAMVGATAIRYMRERADAEDAPRLPEPTSRGREPRSQAYG